MDIVLGAFAQAMAGLVAHVIGLYRRFWPDTEWHRPVEALPAAAALGVVAIAAPLGYVAVRAMQLAMVFLQDQLLLFLALLLGPVLLFAVVLAASGLAAGLAIALGVAAGTSGSTMWAGGFVVVGALEVATFVQLGWHLLAGLTAAATALEIVLLVCLLRAERAPQRHPLPF